MLPISKKGKEERSVLIVSGSDKVYDYIVDLLPQKEFYPISRASSAGEARRILVSQVYDILIINTPLPDDFGIELAYDFADSPTCIMLMVKDEIFNEVVYQVEDAGIATIAKPSNKTTIYNTIKLLSAMSSKLKKMEKKNRTLEEKMNDIRVMNHAKWLLIDKKKITEDEAHHLIEKHAMDRRISKREAAQEIISDYEK
ncbi:MAG: ANTAR domain-containing protein [Lachnospiraceae bacterium]|nr:ANTAR domain-containing protein [Lachnospiraceae bacterium]